MKVYYRYHNIGNIFGDKRKKPAKALDATMKFLRDKAVSQQEKQAERSKKIAGISFLGLTETGDLRFACKSQDGKETYLQSIRFYDLHQRKPRTRDEILNMMRESDVGVYCNDPSFLYWGAAYNATVGKYNIIIENRPPTRSIETKSKFVLCKHMIAVLRAVPFYWNNMVTEYAKYFKVDETVEETKPANASATKPVEEKPEQKSSTPAAKPVEAAKPTQGVGTKNMNEGENK